MNTVWINWKTWSILRKSANGEYNDHVATFGDRHRCEEYLNMKKEQHFFDTGSMDEAEKEWGMQNFLIDYTMILNRSTIARNFTKITFEEWNK